MTPHAIRLTKEARAVLLPWLVVMSLGATQSLIGDVFIGPIRITGITLLGAFIGIPLLATLPFSIEFQHHTLSTLLSQPVDRSKIWADKVLVAIVFALSAAAMYYVNWQPLRGDQTLQAVWPLLIVVTICSSAYWSLVGRSTISGLILNLMATGLWIGVLLYSITLIRFPQWAAVPALALPFAAVMFWLGRRKFIEFESTGATAGTDLMEGSLGRVFRSTRTHAVLNVLRKEVRLLAPVWLLSMSSVLFLLLLTPIRLMTQGSNETLSTIISTLAAVFPGIAFQIAPILGGTLSVGEERARGTQTWNLVLPMSVRRQWLLKFIIGLLTCLASQALVLITVSILGPHVLDQQVNLVFNSWSARLVVLGLSVAIFIPAFWSACAVNGTVRASLLMFPIVGLAGVAGTIGFLLGILPVFGRLNDFLIATFHPFPFSDPWVSQRDHHFFTSTYLLIDRALPLIAITPVFVVAVIQSYRLFRRDMTNQESIAPRNLVPLLIMSLFAGTSISVGKDFFYRPSAQQQLVVNEVHDGVVKMYIDHAPLDSTHPLQVNPEELARTTPLSTVTRNWLRGATVAVYPMDPATSRKVGPKLSPYYVSIVFSTGRECRTAGFYWWCLAPEERTNFRILTTFIDDDVAQSMVISQVKPVLPPEANRSGRSATVKLKVSIDQDGVVQWAHPISGEEPFTSAAIAAVKQWHYQPIRILGWPATAVTNVTVTFD
jgi:TonB family protein